VQSKGVEAKDKGSQRLASLWGSGGGGKAPSLEKESATVNKNRASLQKNGCGPTKTKTKRRKGFEETTAGWVRGTLTKTGGVQ